MENLDVINVGGKPIKVERKFDSLKDCIIVVNDNRYPISVYDSSSGTRIPIIFDSEEIANTFIEKNTGSINKEVAVWKGLTIFPNGFYKCVSIVI